MSPSTLDTSEYKRSNDDSLYTGPKSLVYNPSMAIVDSNTHYLSDNRSELVNNVWVKVTKLGIDLLLIHEITVTDGHVDEAKIVATWHFADLESLAVTRDKIDKFISVEADKPTS